MIQRRVAALYCVGHFPWAPGTAGSLAALPAAVAVHALGGFPLLLASTALALLAGYWACVGVVGNDRESDPDFVVVDELAGQWIALWPVSFADWRLDADPALSAAGIAAAFVLFRILDIAKPGLIGWADRMGGSLGIMLDDAIAGLCAAIVLGAAYAVSAFAGIL